MWKNFESNDAPLAQLLIDAESGSLQLPDFQRSWVWSDDQIRSLLASISLSYPIGALMTLQAGNPDVRFQTRPLEGIELASNVAPSHLLLDGQQRLTSLYLALKSPKPVPIRDARGHRIRRHYYADLNQLDGGTAREEHGIFSVPDDRIVRVGLRQTVTMDLSSRAGEIASEKFPLDQVLSSDAAMNWMMAYVESGPGSRDKRFRKWKRFKSTVLDPFIQYQIPVIALDKSNSRIAVCQVFEKVNTGGVVLTVFELLTATFAADGFDLRKDWKKRRARAFEHPLLKKLEEPTFLQLVTLLATYDRRQRHLEQEQSAERPPAVSCHRADMLKLSRQAYEASADGAERGLQRAASFLTSEGIRRWRDLPYATQLVPLGAVFAILGDAALSPEQRVRLRQWYWCGVLGEMYGGTTPTRFANDLQEVIPWLRRESASSPRTVQEAQFQADRLLSLRTRVSAAYKGIYILLLRNARDPASGERLDPATFPMDGFDVRRIFPRGWCEKNDPKGAESRGLRRPVDRKHWNCIVNKTAIRREMLPFFGWGAPSRDLARLEKQHGLASHSVNRFLRTHHIEPIALRQDDFRSFFNCRFEALVKLVEKAMGKGVNRAEHRDESPFHESVEDPDALRREIDGGESQWLEFKSTGFRNLFTGARDQKMEHAVLKTICGLMNADGGALLVGVKDDGSILGIEEDYPVVKGQNRDGWEKRLVDALSSGLGPSAATGAVPRFCEIERRTVARIEVRPASKPVFVRSPGAADGVLYARIGATTHAMKGKNLLEYQGRRWSK